MDQRQDVYLTDGQHRAHMEVKTSDPPLWEPDPGVLRSLGTAFIRRHDLELLHAVTQFVLADCPAEAAASMAAERLPIGDGTPTSGDTLTITASQLRDTGDIIREITTPDPPKDTPLAWWREVEQLPLLELYTRETRRLRMQEHIRQRNTQVQFDRALQRNIERLREHRGLKKADLARRLGWTRQRYGQTEDDPGRLRPYDLVRLSIALQVPIDQLFDGTPEGEIVRFLGETSRVREKYGEMDDYLRQIGMDADS